MQKREWGGGSSGPNEPLAHAAVYKGDCDYRYLVSEFVAAIATSDLRLLSQLTPAEHRGTAVLNASAVNKIT